MIHRAVEIHGQRPGVDRLQGPVLQLWKDPIVGGLAEFSEKAAVGALRGQAAHAEDLLEHRILANPIARAKTARSDPDVEQEGLHHIDRIIGAIRTALRQLLLFEKWPHSDFIDEILHQTHPAKRRHRLVAILYRQVNHVGYTLERSISFG